MKNHKLILITDTLLTFILCALFSLIILSFASATKGIKIILSLAFSFSASGIFFIQKLNRYNSAIMKNKDRQKLENILYSLELMPDNEVIALLFDLLQRIGVQLKDAKYPLISTTTVYFYNFEKQVSRRFLASCIKQKLNKKIVIFCNKLDDDAEQLAKRLQEKIIVINGEKLFTLIKKYNLSVKEIAPIKTTKIDKIKRVINKIFTKKRAVSFLLIACTLLLFSRFTIFPLYYKICAGISLSVSAVCLFLGKKESCQTEDSLIFN